MLNQTGPMERTSRKASLVIFDACSSHFVGLSVVVGDGMNPACSEEICMQKRVLFTKPLIHLVYTTRIFYMNGLRA